MAKSVTYVEEYSSQYDVYENNDNFSNSLQTSSMKVEPIDNEETRTLKQLLSDWNQEFLLEHFLAQKIFLDVLKVIKHHHIERLLKNFDMGTQILFEHNLEQWRHSIGIPLLHYRDMPPPVSPSPLPQSPLSPSPLPPSTSSCTSRDATLSHEHRFAPYTKPKNLSDDTDMTLYNILQTPKGVMLVQYYNTFLKFQDEQRTTLISLIAQFFEDKGVPMTLGISYRLEKEILERFPTEKLEYYRSSKRGRIYNKFCNLKTSFKAAVGKHVDKPKKDNVSKNYRPEKNFEPEEGAEICLRTLKFDHLTAEQFDNTWKACCQYRLKDLKILQNIATIVDKWPFYKHPIGFRLIDMDFSVAYQNGDGLLSNWNNCSNKVLKFLSNESHVKDKNIKALLKHLNSDYTISDNSRTAILFWALHGYLVPITKSVKKDADTGKSTITKFTIKESQESFLFVGKCLQDVEEQINNLKRKKRNIEPFLYCIGRDLSSIEEIYIFFDNTRFKFFNFLRAVDVCFKIFYVFNLDFPPESTMFYSFLESYFFKFKSQQNFSKVFILSEHLESE